VSQKTLYTIFFYFVGVSVKKMSVACVTIDLSTKRKGSQMISIGDLVTSASGNTSGVAVEVNPITTKSGEKIVRILVETDDNEMKWITLR